MLKNKLMHRNKKKKILPLLKCVCIHSHVNVRKCYLPYVFLLNCCCFLRLVENILEKICVRHCRPES